MKNKNVKKRWRSNKRENLTKSIRREKKKTHYLEFLKKSTILFFAFVRDCKFITCEVFAWTEFKPVPPKTKWIEIP